MFIAILSLPILITSCSSNIVPKSYDYEDIDYLTISWSEIFDVPMVDYFVYVYSPTCGHCQKIKQDILNYAIHHDNFRFVLFNKDIPVLEDVTGTIGKNTVDDIGIKGTPSLFEIYDGVLIKNIVGSTAILETLTNLH